MAAASPLYTRASKISSRRMPRSAVVVLLLSTPLSQPFFAMSPQSCREGGKRFRFSRPGSVAERAERDGFRWWAEASAPRWAQRKCREWHAIASLAFYPPHPPSVKPSDIPCSGALLGVDRGRPCVRSKIAQAADTRAASLVPFCAMSANAAMAMSTWPSSNPDSAARMAAVSVF